MGERAGRADNHKNEKNSTSFHSDVLRREACEMWMPARVVRTCGLVAAAAALLLAAAKAQGLVQGLGLRAEGLGFDTTP
jgi:hypothetical protein